MAMPVMRRIERAAEQPDAARRQETGKRAQGRTWPVPRTTYL
jgi:hypothetical protein